MPWRYSSRLLVAFAVYQCSASPHPEGMHQPLDVVDTARMHTRQQPYDNCSANLDYPKQCGKNWDYTGFTKDQNERAAGVVEMFRFAWDGYYRYAYPHDDLLPTNRTFTDSRNGWGLLMVDALDTAVIMEQTDIVNVILDFIPSIDFKKNNAKRIQYTSLFETNIRYLGGLLSAYDLLKGPFSHLDVHRDKVDALLQQAQSLADTLKFAFNTKTGIPNNYFFINNQTFLDVYYTANGTPTAYLAEFGTLVLEWQHLSDLTGDPSYGCLAQRAESYFFNAQEVWPGLTGDNYSIATGQAIDSDGGWIGGSDSAYEYLIKMFVYDPERYGNYSARWQKAANATIAHLLSHPSSRPDLTMAAAYSGQQLQNYSEQLACFIGGNFILASSVLDDTSGKYLDTGLEFCEFCANGYRTPSGFGPLIYSWNLTELNTNFTNQTAWYEENGWFIDDNDVFFAGQSPEAVESWYYAYQATKDQYWRDVSWAYTLATNRSSRVGVGFLDIKNLFKEDGDGTIGFTMQSFLLAEVFKYMYLVQTVKKGIWDVLYGEDKENQFVYNTEAHPIAVAKKKIERRRQDDLEE